MNFLQITYLFRFKKTLLVYFNKQLIIDKIDFLKRVVPNFFK